MKNNQLNKISGLLFILFVIFSCTPSPEPIDYGSDNCAYCKMTIVQKQFGTELVTSKGKVYKFDSIECLAAYYLKNRLNQKDVHSIHVTDFNNESKFLNAFEAVYLFSSNIRSPMGMNLSSFENSQQVQLILGDKEGKIIEWNEVLALVNDEWLRRGK